MGYSLNDITIYYKFDGEIDKDFRNRVNFISDFYHFKLDGYKPPKTSRICIHLKANMKFGHHGSIFSIGAKIDEERYLSSSAKEQYIYLLDIIHFTIIEAAEQLDWDKKPFEKSYNYILNNDFKFIVEFPVVKSQDRKKNAQKILIKDENTSKLFVRIKQNEHIHELELLDKQNWFWYDSIYFYAKKCKWITKNKFGYQSSNRKDFSFYDLEKQKLKRNLFFEKNNF